MNTVDCSPIGRNRLSSWFSWGNQVGGSETLIGDGNTDGQEGARLEPGSVLRRVQPHLYSTLERDLKNPTLHKLTELCEVMEVHPLTLLTWALDHSRGLYTRCR